MTRTALATLLILVTLAAGAAIRPADETTATAHVRPVPACQEDQTLIGTGDFESGRWTTYVCGPAVDDYAPQGSGE